MTIASNFDKYISFHVERTLSDTQAINKLAENVRDVLLEREARCLLDRIGYKLWLAEEYGDIDPDYVSSLRESEAALKKTLRFAEGCE
jgi:uncharacterized protein YutE (UPF0331/DUF86 family)